MGKRDYEHEAVEWTDFNFVQDLEETGLVMGGRTQSSFKKKLISNKIFSFYSKNKNKIFVLYKRTIEL